MKFEYIAENEEKVIDSYWIDNRARKIKEPVTITIKIEMDEEKYYSQKRKYKTPIHQRIAKLFGFKVYT